MSFLSLSFASPLLLLGLLALPLIWWLNRLTPPKPVQEPFPPLSILMQVLKKEDTPTKSPWWLTLLRLILCAFIIIALAEPVLNPRKDRLASSNPLVLILDNSWASATNWQLYLDTANGLIDEAEAKNIPVLVTRTALSANDLRLGTIAEARKIIASIEPEPLEPFQTDIITPIKTALSGQSIGTIALITNDIQSDNTSSALEALLTLAPESLSIFTANNDELAAITSVENLSSSIAVSIERLKSDQATEIEIIGYDFQLRPLFDKTIELTVGENSAAPEIDVPFELLNDIMRISLRDNQHAGASYLLDDSFRRRRIAIFSGETLDIVNPLLSAPHYIRKATSPYVDILDLKNISLSSDITPLLDQNPSAIILSNVGTLSENIIDELSTWVNDGGTLIRFAGAKLAATTDDNMIDTLLPVTLRQGERQLGGSLSWSEPKPMAGFTSQSPFFGIEISDEVKINRQVLAEPSLELADQTWASLDDGTPLVTAKQSGLGRIVLFHISAETTWSNLPLSGIFSQMLRRIISLTRASNSASNSTSSSAQSNAFLPAFKSLSAKGGLINANGDVSPLEILPTGAAVLTPTTRPGLFGTEDGWVAVNLLKPERTLTPFEAPTNAEKLATDISNYKLENNSTTILKPWLFIGAFILLILDAIIIMYMSGLFGRNGLSRTLKLGATSSAVMLAGTLAMSIIHINPTQAQDIQLGDAEIISRLEKTHLAYVVTGDQRLDRVSKLGLDGLSFYLRTRTALEPGTPVGLNLEQDDLSFYPIIYWPMSENAPIPSEKAIANIANFMTSGGTVLFDTRDEFAEFGSSSNTSPRTLKLRAILSGLDIPPLEPVPQSHVLTKSFYLLDNFPGRYATGTLWVEAQRPNQDEDNRIVNAGDGVSPIMITSNDFAAAWAINASRQHIFPTVPQSERQRVLAYRTGINIIMYMLTGNYKADQVHFPALLERLGQ
tara:strand:- start:1336 stop:4197 length:2862 start_codon:yes stop_codon:yes gene_type:complete